MSDRKPPFAVDYNHNGKTYRLTLWAESWDDAQNRLRSIGGNGRVVGSDVQQFRPNGLTLPITVLWVRLVCWWRNLGRRS